MAERRHPGHVLVVVPAFNEEASLSATLASLQGLEEGFEVLVVDDGSADGTAGIVRDWSARSRVRLRFVSLPMNSGIGAAVQTGYLFARAHERYEWVVQFDADGQHDARAIPELVAECRSRGLDLCIGSRFLGAPGEGFRSTFSRRIGIGILSRLVSLLARVHVTDPTSGFRCAGPRAWRSFARRYPDDYPEPESLFWCARNGLRVGEIPVRMFPRHGGSSSIRGAWYMVKVSVAILIDRLRRGE